jgi:hypothetical protein
MEREQIREKIEGLIDTIVVPIVSEGEGLSPAEKLGIILSESLQALIFVTTVEDEFDIQLDDEEVDLQFFEDIDIIIDRVERHLNDR